jgi:hypothetical protein
MARKLSFFSVGVEGELVFVCLCGPGRVLQKGGKNLGYLPEDKKAPRGFQRRGVARAVYCLVSQSPFPSQRKPPPNILGGARAGKCTVYPSTHPPIHPGGFGFVIGVSRWETAI